jgi:hypothetical protein
MLRRHGSKRYYVCHGRKRLHGVSRVREVATRMATRAISTHEVGGGAYDAEKKVGRALVSTASLAVAIGLATLAIFAAQARAGSFAKGPPQAVLMKGSYVIQVRTVEAAHWFFYERGRWVETHIDSFDFAYPKADAVKAGRILTVRFGKPQRPSAVGITAYPRLDANGDHAGHAQRLEPTLARVERGGKTIAWDVFFRINRPDRHYYLDLSPAWERVPGTRASYGDEILYLLHVRTLPASPRA